MESSMANFTAFYCHMDGISRFLTNLNDYVHDETVRGLLITWMQSRLSVWWTRSYFSSVKLQRLLPSIPLPRILQGQPKSLHERRVEIISIMCDSHYLSTACILRHWDCDQSIETVISEPSDEPGTDAVHHHLLLTQQVQRLDRWIQHLPSAEQPLMDLTSTGDVTTPLRFISHDAALNYAYYLTSCILQCQNNFCTLPSICPTIARMEGRTTDSYICLLLRIAKASPPVHHLTKNTYTIGFTNLLLTALLRTTSVSLAIEIQNFVQSLADTLPTEEGGFPIYQALEVIKLINVRKMAGKDVVAVSQPVDDHGGEPKYQSYNSQAIRDLFFHGRERTGGALFTERVVVCRPGKSNGGEWRWGRGRKRPVIYVSRSDKF
ncbi:similar to An15g05180 [Aspergillus luchuensis IFO 4308]|nr:similar to An15g05180 [Aspergillus luchuensis IFO 4308]